MGKLFDFNVYNPLECVYHIQDASETCATLIVGEKQGLLVDTCTGCGDLRAVAEALTDKPLLVVNTHGHLDHIGGNYQFSKVYMNKAEIQLGLLYIDKLDIRPGIVRRFAEMGYGMEEERKKAFLAYHMENVAVLDMEEEIDLGGIHVQPVPMYSHSPGMTGFYVRERGLLLGGDSVCILVCLYFDESSSVEGHLEMLERVSDIGFSYILTSHSKELLDRDDFEAMMECARSFDQGKTFRYADPFYPQLRGRMYMYESSVGKHAIVVEKRSIRQS